MSRISASGQRGAQSSGALAGHVALLVSLAPILIFSVYPVGVLVANSVGLGAVRSDDGFTLKHYEQAITSGSVHVALGNSAMISLGSVAICLAVVLPIVLRRARPRRRGREGVVAVVEHAILTAPIALPGIIIGFFAIVLVGRTGLLALVWNGFSGVAYLFGGMLIAYVYFSLPRVLGPLRAAAASLDPALAECAGTLGASRLRVFATITLPILLPAIIEACATATAVALGGYGTVATLSAGVRLLPLNVVNELTTGYRLADSSTLAVLLAAIAVLSIVSGRVLSRFSRWAVSRA
ncbi:ABC transporter permease subunit [Sinomonas albida]|uniref:ABC transporter permease subunit n=1 Tax=Sinomonas albida TaxID=369942 RepID=UPI001B3C4C85|nr:ABC transporter permease subunit [Sinomonas albida]